MNNVIQSLKNVNKCSISLGGIEISSITLGIISSWCIALFTPVGE